jgi:DNA polymerase III delta prime subunit
MLIILGGLPGAGKTTLASALARRLDAVHLRIDTIEQAIRDADVLAADVGPAGYLVGYGIAQDGLAVTRQAWRAVAQRAGCQAVEIEVICSDVDLHRHRVVHRQTDVEGLVKPDWPAVIGRVYQPWPEPSLVVDTARKATNVLVDEIIAAIARTPPLNAAPV